MLRTLLAPGDLYRNQFRIRRLLGSGGYATVYHALDEFAGEEVALKLIGIPAEPAALRERRVQQAKREVRALHRLQHKNIVRIRHATVPDERWIYIVMELLVGRNLREVLHLFGPLDVLEVLLIAAQIAEGASAAHQANVIHCDLKPENNFIVRDNEVRIIDFGVAKLLDPDGKTTTQRLVLQGTTNYISPEQLQGKKATPASDMFALGVIMYELLTGFCPAVVGAQETTLKAIIYRQLFVQPPSIHTLRPDVPEFVDLIVRRLLAKEPADRYDGMSKVVEVLCKAIQLIRDGLGEAASETRDLSCTEPPPSVAAERPLSPADKSAGTYEIAAALTRPLTSPTALPPAALPTPLTRTADTLTPRPAAAALTADATSGAENTSASELAIQRQPTSSTELAPERWEPPVTAGGWPEAAPREQNSSTVAVSLAKAPPASRRAARRRRILQGVIASCAIGATVGVAFGFAVPLRAGTNAAPRRASGVVTALAPSAALAPAPVVEKRAAQPPEPLIESALASPQETAKPNRVAASAPLRSAPSASGAPSPPSAKHPRSVVPQPTSATTRGTTPSVSSLSELLWAPPPRELSLPSSGLDDESPRSVSTKSALKPSKAPLHKPPAGGDHVR